MSPLSHTHTRPLVTELQVLLVSSPTRLLTGHDITHPFIISVIFQAKGAHNSLASVIRLSAYFCSYQREVNTCEL